MNSKQFADHTQRFLDALPHWFDMRQDVNSIGAQFLNVAGLAYDELSLALSEAEDALYLSETSVDGLDILYKTLIPVHLDAKRLTSVYSNDYTLTRAMSIKEFKSAFIDEPERVPQERHLYFLDDEKNILYVQFPYDATRQKPYGKITYLLDGGSYEQDLMLHHVWNFLDEFGLLLCCPRLTEETNARYKERLLDVFKHPAGANKTGLLNGISRELSLRQHLTWQKTSEPLTIQDQMVVLETIEIDGKKVSTEDYAINSFGQIELHPRTDKTSPVMVSYVHGIEMHKLGDRSDVQLQRELLNLDNTASDLLKYYVERIHLEAPMDWGHFKWDESYWDTANPEVTGKAFVPNLQDARIDGFKAYR